MKALSIRPPWAWAIVRCGKDVENRTWYTGYRGEVLIHACRLPPATRTNELLDAMDDIRDIMHPASPPVLTCNQLRAQSGGIVARARIVDCVRSSPSPWFCGEVPVCSWPILCQTAQCDF
jgi:hypothetical protein